LQNPKQGFVQEITNISLSFIYLKNIIACPHSPNEFINENENLKAHHQSQLYFFFIIHMSIQGLDHFSPLPPPPPLPPTLPLPFPPHPLDTQQKLFFPYL
jgi:hypothetical protein